MPRLVLGLALAPLLAAGSAFAQAPSYDYGGDYYAGPSATAPTPYAQPPVQPAPPAFTSRWSFAAAVGSMSLAPDDNPDATADFDIGELALRYRGWHHLEVELSLAGGSLSIPDDQKDLRAGDPEVKMSHITLAARYRFNPQDHLNWWLLAGFGATTIAPDGAPKEQMDANKRSHGLVGIGLEYRWVKFALQAEAKAIGMSPTDDEQKIADETGETVPSLSGGSFTIGGAFYF